MRKNKIFRKAMSLLLSLAILVGTVAIAFPLLKVSAAEIIEIDGVSQTPIVMTDRETTYSNYAINYLNGAGESTGIVIPGLPEPQDYVIQGMTYYPEKDWMIVTAYHNYDAKNDAAQYSSKAFCLDAKTGDFVAMLSFRNADGTTNFDHGGGIAFSENNIYYSCGDMDRSIAYAPISALDGIEVGEHRVIDLVDEIEFYEVGSITSENKTAYTAYVCYDQGYLWTGNFFDQGANLIGIDIAAQDYNTPATYEYNSMVFGYKLQGSGSEEEWNYLKGIYKNLLSVTTASGLGTSNGSNHNWSVKQNGESITISGGISAPTAYVGEFTGSFGSATLTEGETYRIDFDSTNDKTDMYMFSPAGTHCNVKQSTATTITDNGDGTYHYSMTFSAGLKPNAADSTWPTTQSTDGSYTGTYTLRFDQDAIDAGEQRFYEITNVRISVAKEGSYSTEAGYRGTPSHAIALDNNIKNVQYAVVDNGKLYLSCSFGSGAGNSVSFGFGETSKLIVADIDLSAEPTADVTISKDKDNTIELFEVIKAHKINVYDIYDMMPMSEGLCIVNDLIFCTFEGASNKYLKESGGLTGIGNCEKPVDVIWKIDPYALENTVKTIDTESLYYEKVNSLAEIKNGEEYLIVYESPEKDPVTQKNILYALDANGGYHDYRLSKRNLGTTAGYVGALGHPITEYSVEGNKMYLSNAQKDDVRNVRWEINSLGSGSYSIQSPDYYFVSYPNFYCDASTISMTTDAVRGTNMKIHDSGNGEGGFWISNNDYYLWCNDGTTASYNNAYNDYYTNSTSAMYSGIVEQPGTFHTDALNISGSNILGGAFVSGPDTNYAHGIFNIYKRVIDSVASTYESRVYTDMKAELTEDGTYTIDLETYAISPNHYEYVGERPTDYIIVMDTSASVNDDEDGTALAEWPNTLGVVSLCPESATEDDNGEGVSGYSFSVGDEGQEIYIKHTDGEFYKVYLAVNTTSISKFLGAITGFEQSYWAYYIANDGRYYVLKSGGGTYDPIDVEKFISNVDNNKDYSANTTKTFNSNRRSTVVYTGTHYSYQPGNNAGKALATIKEAATKIVDQIVADGTDNRIAITQYGSSSSYLSTSGWASSGYTNALWEANSTNASTLKTEISNITSTTQTDNTGIELTAATGIMDNSGADYTADGARNVAIIFISDGTPGADANSDTTTAANNVIAKAYTAKNKGAFIYTVVAGSKSSFDRRTYMDAVSSKYPAATSMNMVDGVYTDLGGANVDGVNYVMNLSTCSFDYYNNFSSVVRREIVKNNAVGLANLNASAIICEELNDAFKPITDGNGNFADGIKVTYSLVPGDFDKVERFAFREDEAVVNPTGITVTPDSSNLNKLSITGYDYSTEYISKGKEGRKLKIRIEGVLANEEADLKNTSINNTATTAVYRNNDVFKFFPTEYFNIPEYTYVLDYDMPMYDGDINGTLVSVDGGLNRQDPNNYSKSRVTDNVALRFDNQVENGHLDMTYELVSGEYNEEDNRSFCLIKRDDGTYDWFRINIIPASNVLYEEGRFEKSDAGSLTKSNWVTDGTPIKEYQTLSGDDDRYGYDENYANNGAGYSNGTALKATVNSTTKRSETMTFSYTGKGFDLMAVCGTNTGVQLVNVKKADGSIEKVYMVDTYYNDSAINGGDTLKQVPIVNHTNKNGYGNYTVEVTAAYLANAQAVTGGRYNFLNKAYTPESLLKDMGINAATTDVEYVWFNDNSVLNGGTGVAAEGNSNRADSTSNINLDCYIDGIRVYNPLGNDNSLYIDSEKGASYYNIVNELAKTEGGVITSEGDLFAYVVGELEANEEGNIPKLSFGNYQSVGPQNEIYLQPADANSHAVAFNVTVPNSVSRVMISLRAVDGKATAKVASGDKSITFEINSATEQYFDITPYLDIDTTNGKANVVITNSGSTGLLSVNNIKLVDATASIVEGAELNQMAMSLALAPTVVDPNSYDYDAIVSEGVKPGEIPGGNNPSVDEPEVDEPVVDEPTDDNTDVETPVVENIFTKIINFFKNFFKTFFGK